MRKKIFIAIFFFFVFFDLPLFPFSSPTDYLLSQRLVGGSLSVKFLERKHVGLQGIPIYDVKVLSQNQRYSGSKYFRPLYGCGFHSLKNTIFLTQCACDKKCNALGYFQKLVNKKIFVNLFEKDNQKSWYFLWYQYRLEKSVYKVNQKFLLDDPPTQNYDLENLKQKIIDGKAGASSGGKGIMKYTNIIEYLEDGLFEKTNLVDAFNLVLLSQIYQEADSIVIFRNFR